MRERFATNEAKVGPAATAGAKERTNTSKNRAIGNNCFLNTNNCPIFQHNYSHNTLSGRD
jgi:hypothetical protein